MIDLRPFDDHAAYHVLSSLDANDQREAELVRGRPVNGLALYADWRGVEGARLLSLVIATGHDGWGTPFAVLGLGHTGQAGVAQAALLARDHKRFRRPLAELGSQIRARLPVVASEAGLRRIEARCWARHPTAGRLLSLCGFTRDCAMPGFGPGGAETFEQYAWMREN